MSDLANVCANLQAELLELERRLAGTQEDLTIERLKSAALEASLREHQNTLAEKNATLERLQRERAEFWQKLLEDDGHGEVR